MYLLIWLAFFVLLFEASDFVREFDYLQRDHEKCILFQQILIVFFSGLF
jgi:hypothetical protein